MNMALHTAELYRLTKLSINIKNTEQISTYILTPVLVYINVTLFRTNIADKKIASSTVTIQNICSGKINQVLLRLSFSNFYHFIRSCT